MIPYFHRAVSAKTALPKSTWAQNRKEVAIESALGCESRRRADVPVGRVQRGTVTLSARSRRASWQLVSDCLGGLKVDHYSKASTAQPECQQDVHRAGCEGLAAPAASGTMPEKAAEVRIPPQPGTNPQVFTPSSA